MVEPRHTPERSLTLHSAAIAGALLALAGGFAALSALIDVSGAVIASGNLVVESELKKVQHPSGGVVSDILVREGVRVEKNQVLMRLDPTVAKATLNAVTADLWELSARRSRLEAERDGADAPAFEPSLLNAAVDPSLASLLEGEKRLFRYRTETLSGQKAQLRERIKQLHDETTGLEGQRQAKRLELRLVEKELEGVRELWEKKLIPSTRLMALERERARLGGEAGKLEAALAQTRGKIAETELQIIEVDQTARTDVAKQLADIRAKTSELTEKRTTALDQSERTEIRAPQAGIVLGLSVHTRGGVVGGGEQLMQIVPDGDTLIAEARVRPVDIDQLGVGQGASLRFSNLNQRTTPEIEGRVVRISADAIRDERVDEPYYVVRLSFDRSAISNDVALLPGMPVQVFIRTDARSLASYLTKPMTDQMRHAFREK